MPPKMVPMPLVSLGMSITRTAGCTGPASWGVVGSWLVIGNSGEPSAAGAHGAQLESAGQGVGGVVEKVGHGAGHVRGAEHVAAGF